MGEFQRNDLRWFRSHAVSLHGRETTKQQHAACQRQKGHSTSPTMSLRRVKQDGSRDGCGSAIKSRRVRGETAPLGWISNNHLITVAELHDSRAAEPKPDGWAC